MEEKRELAKLKIKRAHQLERKQAAKEKIIEEYGQGITIYLQISEKTPDDLHALTEAYYSLATFYFNLKEYVKAGECYLEGIKNLLHTKLNDDSYRKLTELYINLSDACYESMKQHAGNEAMTNAIKAFGLIQNKTPEEQKIGDPVINFKQFHDFYERELSTDTYLESSKFANHEYLLSEGQLVRQQEALLEQFETISLKEIQQIDTSIEGMLSQLSLAAEKILLILFYSIKHRAMRLIGVWQCNCCHEQKTWFKTNSSGKLLKPTNKSLKFLKPSRIPRQVTVK